MRRCPIISIIRSAIAGVPIPDYGEGPTCLQANGAGLLWRSRSPRGRARRCAIRTSGTWSGAWNRTLPDGSVETVTVPMEGPEERVSPNGIYRVPARKAVRPGPAELKLHRVGYRRPYARSLDLSAMCDFSKPGKYCVRLFYDNGRIADGDKVERVEEHSRARRSTLTWHGRP